MDHDLLDEVDDDDTDIYTEHAERVEHVKLRLQAASCGGVSNDVLNL